MTVFLIVLLTISSPDWPKEIIYPMKDMDTCLKSVETAQLALSHSSDTGYSMALFCVNEQKVRFKSTKE